MLTQEIKNELIAEGVQHRKQDLLIKGSFWKGHKGCSVGCYVKTGDEPHAKLAKRSGMPEYMHRLQDIIFEGLPDKTRFHWSEVFFKAAPVGLSDEGYNKNIKIPFLIYVLKSTLTTFNHIKNPDVKKAVDTVIKLYEDGETDPSKFNAAAHAADAANTAAYVIDYGACDANTVAYAAYYAAKAADAANAFATDNAATYATYSAADAADAFATSNATYTAFATANAATYATYAAADATYAADATGAAANAAYATLGNRMQEFADELIRLMKGVDALVVFCGPSTRTQRISRHGERR